MTRVFAAPSIVTAKLVLLLGSALALSGCSAGDADTPRPSELAPASLEAAGPWADAFREALDADVSDSEARVLADGRVTTQELEDAHTKVDKCLRDSELTISYFADGGFEVGSTVGKSPSNDIGRTNKILEACESKFDQSITFLFEETRRNPGKLDDAKITVPCLRKAGLVGRDYTEEQWRKDQDADAFPFDSMGEQAKQCALDPLALWRQ